MASRLRHLKSNHRRTERKVRSLNGAQLWLAIFQRVDVAYSGRIRV